MKKAIGMGTIKPMIASHADNMSVENSMIMVFVPWFRVYVGWVVGCWGRGGNRK